MTYSPGLARLARGFQVLVSWQMAMDDAEFEQKHKRAKDGKFAKQAGAGEGAKQEAKPAKEKKESAKKAAAKPKQVAKKIEDIGEKIGGARKDKAIKTGPGKKATIIKPADARPEWEKRYVAIQNVKTGDWHLQDTKSGVSRFSTGRVLPTRFETKEEAERFRPIAAVARNHSVYRGNADGTYSIWRKVTDRKRVQVVPDSFASYDEAMRYMANNAESILRTKTGFGEEILAKPEKVYRKGEAYRDGDVDPRAFKDELRWRAVEFGNWQGDRQEVLNHAYDALHDLSWATSIHPADLSMNGELGLAFGARGQGLSHARAHYEPGYAAMNLTKMKGAGSLAHEWLHALDHYLGRLDDPRWAETKTSAEGHRLFKTDPGGQYFASHRTGRQGSQGKLHEEVRQAHGDLMRALQYKPEQYQEDTDRAQRFVNSAKQEMQKQVAAIRKDLAEQKTYGKRFVKPATEAQLKRFDAAAAKLEEGGKHLDTEWRASAPEKNARSRAGFSGRVTNEALEEMSKVMKEVRGRSGFGSGDTRGPFDDLRADMKTLQGRQRMLDDAKAQSVKTKMVPTSFAMEARKADQGRVEDYWQHPHEMKARAFSAYIEDKLRDAKRRSDYLSYGSDNYHYALAGIKPFPEGEERKELNKHFDKLFASIRKAGIMRTVPKRAKPAQDGAIALTGLQRLARDFNRLVWAGAMDREYVRGGNPENSGQFSEEPGGGAKKKGTTSPKRADAKAPKAGKPAPRAKLDAKLVSRLEEALSSQPELLAKVKEALSESKGGAPKSSGRSRIAGEPRKIVTPDGKMEVEATPELVELADLVHASGDLQPRNRNTAESRTTARERAAKLDPEQLQPGRVSDAGAPIIDAGGTVISGNGRTMSIREAYNDPAFKAKAEAYRKALGVEAKGMKQPVLVMRLPKDTSHEKLVEFADRSNRSRIEGMSATERARRDAKAAGPDVVALYRGGDFTSPENRAFMHAFTQKAMSANERAQFSKEGRLTKEGQDRLSAAVLASAYDDVDALSIMLESTDDNVKSITSAMKDTAGRFAELKAGVAAGRIKPDMDVTAQIADAAKLVSNLRKKGVSPASHFAQIDAFSRPDPMVEALVKSFYNDNLSRSLSQQKITGILNAYADEAMKHQPGGFLPDDTKAEEVLSLASKKAKAEGGSESADLFGGHAGNEQGNGEGGKGNGRRRASKGSSKAGKSRKGLGSDSAAILHLPRLALPGLAKLAQDFNRLLAAA